MEQWRTNGVLAADDEPSLYLYTQTFHVPGDNSGAVMERRGFIALGQLENYDQKVVFRHEQTLSKPKADRLNLLRSTQTHFGQLFMLYSDPAAEIDAALRQSGPPTAKSATNTMSCTGCGRSPTRASFRPCRRRWLTRS